MSLDFTLIRRAASGLKRGVLQYCRNNVKILLRKPGKKQLWQGYSSLIIIAIVKWLSPLEHTLQGRTCTVSIAL